MEKEIILRYSTDEIIEMISRKNNNIKFKSVKLSLKHGFKGIVQE